MSKKDDKWTMFKQFLHNELGISKDDIRQWVNEAVAIEARKIVEESFQRTNPEKLIREAIADEDFFFPKGFSERVIKATAQILAQDLSIVRKEKKTVNVIRQD